MPDLKNKTEEPYHGLLKEGYKKDAIRTANTPNSEEKGGKTKPYDEWTKEELYQQAIKAGIPGRSYMNKKSLIKSLQNN